MEPIRVKLDKQGATSSKEEKTVDAIVCPQLTITLNNPTSNQVTVVCLQQEKVMENFGNGGVGPPSRILSSPTPLPYFGQMGGSMGVVNDLRVSLS